MISARAVLAVVLLLAMTAAPSESAPPTQPNIVFIMADDLGYGDLGCYGQKIIKTPRIDQMANQGMRFSQFYAGSTVCAPSRCVLMTGLHTGHCLVRGNKRINLRPQDVTVAEILQGAGYDTALVGKWGLGQEGSLGVPTKQGFDYFFGYLDQGHAHNYYPTFLVRNEQRVMLRNIAKEELPTGAGYAAKKVDYSHDLMVDDVLQWIDDHRDKRFFLYWAPTIPHANNEATRPTGNGQEVPDYGIYSETSWSDPDKGQAAMISRLDRDVGRLLDRLQKHGIDDNTIVLFTSDNGHHREGANHPEFFNANGPLRGMKRDLYEGGIRVPLVVRWPGKVRSSSTSEHIGYFGDLIATAAELASVPIPKQLDSISFLPTLLGTTDRQQQHDYLYWEFYEQNGRRAVRMDRWKGVRPTWHGPIELYDLQQDLSESNNVAAQHPAILKQVAQRMEEAHVPSSLWPVPLLKAGK